MRALKEKLRSTFIHRAYRLVFPFVEAPAYEVKREIIKAHGERLGLRTLVETGTCTGETAIACAAHFERIVTIELSESLAQRAKEVLAPYPHVQCYQGDSAEVLGAVLPTLGGPALFWLDAHYSSPFHFHETGELMTPTRGASDTPLFDEIEIILSQSPHNHALLIDDARELGKGSYPSLSRVKRLVNRHRKGWTCHVEDDILRVLPPQS